MVQTTRKLRRNAEGHRDDESSGSGSRASRRATWRRLLRETEALLTQARYLPLDLGERCVSGSGPRCVLLHGLYASAGVFRPLREQMANLLGCSSYSFSYRPGPGIEELSERLARLLGTIDGSEPIHLIGHSLGGLVACHYVSRADCDPRVCETISLAAPFLGSRRHGLVPGQAGRDLRPGAPGLERLRSGAARRQGLPHLTLVAAEDRLIEPGAYPSFGDHALVARTGHNGILFAPEALSIVVARVDSTARACRSARG